MLVLLRNFQKTRCQFGDGYEVYNTSVHCAYVRRWHHGVKIIWRIQITNLVRNLSIINSLRDWKRDMYTKGKSTKLSINKNINRGE